MRHSTPITFDKFAAILREHEGEVERFDLGMIGDMPICHFQFSRQCPTRGWQAMNIPCDQMGDFMEIEELRTYIHTFELGELLTYNEVSG